MPSKGQWFLIGIAIFTLIFAFYVVMTLTYRYEARKAAGLSVYNMSTFARLYLLKYGITMG